MTREAAAAPAPKPFRPPTPEKLVLAGPAGPLEALCEVPDGYAGRDCAVVCHPHPLYGGTMHNKVVHSTARALQERGFATLRFNFRGVGASTGRYDNGQGEARDARAAVDLLRKRLTDGAIALVGYSFGAIVALLAGHDHAAVSRLAAIAPPVSMFDVGFLRGCRKPTLFIVGDDDQYCSRGALERSVGDLAGSAAVRQVPGADHFFFGHETTVAEAVTHFVTTEHA